MTSKLDFCIESLRANKEQRLYQDIRAGGPGSGRKPENMFSTLDKNNYQHLHMQKGPEGRTHEFVHHTGTSVHVHVGPSNEVTGWEHKSASGGTIKTGSTSEELGSHLSSFHSHDKPLAKMGVWER